MKNQHKAITLADLRNDIIGIDTVVPLLDGTEQRYVFLDNGASTPALRSVLRSLEEYMPWYSGVHRGTGLKSLVSTDLFDEAHDTIGKFVGADLSRNVVILVKNTTEAINKLSNRFNFQRDDVVITTQMEHHSNDLPWRKHATVVHVGVDDEGRLLLDEFQAAIKTHQKKLKLIAVIGASNITGICNPVHTLARWAHEAGVPIFVDAAQLAPHRAIDMLPGDHPEHIDFIAFSAHKMYAPFGIGVLIGPTAFFEQGEPDMVGGGVVNAVTLDKAYWNSPPYREEAGSPNVPGAIALARVIEILQEVGMDTIAHHEAQVLEYAYSKLTRIPRLQLYGPLDDLTNKVGVITFNIEGLDHSLVAAIASIEGGIGLRDGCFCAHPYVKRLLKTTPAQDEYYTNRLIAGIRSEMPGMVRASLGAYNNEEDIDVLCTMLERIARGEYKGEYLVDEASGVYTAKGMSFNSMRSCAMREGS